MSHRQSRSGQRAVRVANARFTKMEDGGCQHRAGMAVRHPFGQMRKPAHASARNHRHGDRIGNRPRQFQIKAFARAIAIHRGDQQFASTQFRQTNRVSNGVYESENGSMMSGVQRRLLGIFSAMRMVKTRESVDANGQQIDTGTPAPGD